MFKRLSKFLAPSLQSKKQAEFRLKETEPIRPKNKILTHLSATGLALLLALVVMQFPLQGIQGILFDGLVRLSPHTGGNPEIALIGYDDASSAHYLGTTRIPPAELARILEALEADHPLAIAILAPINENTYSATELEMLAGHFEKFSNLFVGYTDDESLGKNAPVALRHTAKYLPGFVSRDTFSYGADSVTRRVMVSIEGIPTVYLKIAELLQEDLGVNTRERASTNYERYHSSVQTYIHWQGPSGTYPIFPSYDVATRRIPSGTFTRKVVLIGSTLASKKGADHIFTPFSREHFGTTALEGAAQGLATLLNQNGFSRASAWMGYLLTALIAILTVNTVLFLSPGRGILFVFLEIALLGGAAWLLLLENLLWIDIAHPLIVAGIGYYLVIPYRLINEYRKRWHYQEKSEFMGQLERLKSNFLSLISHDLKTPIARIQGNAESALSSLGLADAEKQKASLNAIVQTTEDLSRYIETVLDLTRVEHAQVPLHKTSKDINSVIVEVVDRYRYLAEEKNIELKIESEPVFSFKFDSRLITQVIANLLLNAIKYSPANTAVTLKVSEEKDWVKVSIADQGAGIASEDRERVFEKFYRGNSEVAQKEKGTGLGLYLVKYFVELHQGMVKLESEIGKGSIFTVLLPV